MSVSGVRTQSSHFQTLAGCDSKGLNSLAEGCGAGMHVESLGRYQQWFMKFMKLPSNATANSIEFSFKNRSIYQHILEMFTK